MAAVSCAALLMAAGCAPAAKTGLQAADESAAPAEQEYVIGSGDTLSIFVYHAPELSDANVPVRPDGKISVPLVQDIQASGKTAKQLASDLEGRLKKYVKDPNVTVTVRNFVGPLDRQVKVIGEAVSPEAIPYRDHLTVLDVMIETKVLTKYAAGNRSVIVRRLPSGKQETIHVRLADLIKDGDITQNVAMAPGDTLIIPQSWF
jgi:polysaccharide export outer membrane protein